MSDTSQSQLSQAAARERELQPVAAGIKGDAIEDIPDPIAQIDAILKRLRWRKKQETDCLQHNYGKLSQSLLTPEELVDFREYLEIYIRNTEEIHRLRWTLSQGKTFFQQAYGKEARHLLNGEELFDLLQYLESLSLGMEVPNTSQSKLSEAVARERELQLVAAGISSDAIEDISDTIAQIDATLKRLQWKKKQESDCLEHNYGKLSQGVLPAAELVDFLEYLEIYSRTTEEIQRLQWTLSQGKDYLKQAYGKEARHFLNREELFDFLQYLESLP